MEEQLKLLKTEFSIVKENIHTIHLNSASIKTKIEKLRTIYSQMVSENSSKKIFLFCLESFNFQIKSFSVDNENLNKSLLLISNRVYCDYYKLFKLIKSLFEEYKYSTPKEIVEPPVYDILNPFFEYSVETISKMHGDVTLMLETLIDYYNNNCDNIQAYNCKSQTGICITNFIKTLEYDNSVLKDQINLYLSYMDFFKNTQIKHLMKLLCKMELLKKEINDEINYDIDEDICPVTPNNSVKDDSDGDDGPYLELTTPILMTRSILSNSSASSNSSVSSKVTRNTSKSVSSEASELSSNSGNSSNSSNISEISAKSNTNEISVASVSTVSTTSTEKKKRKIRRAKCRRKTREKKRKTKNKRRRQNEIRQENRGNRF